MCTHVFYLVTGVLITTHAIQPTDQKYGWFKSIYQHNLKKPTDFQLNKNNMVQLVDLSILIFGRTFINNGVDIDKGIEDAFEGEFGFD